MMAFRLLRISVRHFTKRFAEQTNAGGLRYDGRYSLSRFLVLCVPPSDHFLQLREEWGYPYWVTTDAGSADLLITLHGTCETRECAAKTTLENSFSGEMGGGTYTYLTLVGTFRTNPACRVHSSLRMLQIKSKLASSMSLSLIKLFQHCCESSLNLVYLRVSLLRHLISPGLNSQ